MPTQYGGRIKERLVSTYKTHAINFEAHFLNVRVNLLAELWLQELLSVIEASNLTGCEILYLTKLLFIVKTYEILECRVYKSIWHFDEEMHEII